ncbi:hypothetical protein SISNIDRAFT_459980 [Sistotremastrum niveocremeum HHB9708]|uniref:Uncharacterized protein n=1 Tax=Sistotremastrum niveocremeum HHB9708 TaxID=1314777 RepID=A0A164P2B4_9AGAM|nr:hypothetical protein SISNIDRAFT_459980 [Sistotremastrum niveocremeum HHB9708]
MAPQLSSSPTSEHSTFVLPVTLMTPPSTFTLLTTLTPTVTNSVLAEPSATSTILPDPSAKQRIQDILVAVRFLIFVLLGYILYMRYKRKKISNQARGSQSSEPMPMRRRNQRSDTSESRRATVEDQGDLPRYDTAHLPPYDPGKEETTTPVGMDQTDVREVEEERHDEVPLLRRQAEGDNDENGIAEQASESQETELPVILVTAPSLKSNNPFRNRLPQNP